jgi:hypothetical protein
VAEVLSFYEFLSLLEGFGRHSTIYRFKSEHAKADRPWHFCWKVVQR